MAGLYDPYAAPIFPQGGAFGTGSPAETAQQPAGADWLMQGIYNAIGNLSKRAFGASEEMRQGGAYNPAPAVEASMLPMGTGAIAGVPMRAGEAVLGSGAIRAEKPPGFTVYHGSPHDIPPVNLIEMSDGTRLYQNLLQNPNMPEGAKLIQHYPLGRFDMSKIGTGEGAQAYGHGLYFAGNEKVAKGYRDALARPTIDNAAIDDTNPRHVAASYLDQYKTPEAALAGLEKDLQWGEANKQFAPPQPVFDALWDARTLLRNGAELPKIGPEKGHMYEVRINADPAHFLDWDKPLSQQAPQVQEALKKAMGKNWDEFKHANAGTAVRQGFIAPSPEGTAAKLNLPGIKYLDQGSRTAGEGSRNYVVFDDKLIDIMKKYGLLGLPAGGTAAPLFLGQEQKS